MRPGGEGGVSEASRGRGGRREGGGYFAGFVLGDFVLGVLLAVFAFAVGAAGFGDVDLDAGRTLLAGDTGRTVYEDGYGGRGAEMGGWEMKAVLVARGGRKRLGRMGSCSLCRRLGMVAFQCFV